MFDQSDAVCVLKSYARKKFYAFLPKPLFGNPEPEFDHLLTQSDEYTRFCIGVVRVYEKKYGELGVDVAPYLELDPSSDKRLKSQWIQMSKLHALDVVFDAMSDIDAETLYSAQRTLLNDLIDELSNTTAVDDYEAFLRSKSTNYGISVAQLSSFIVERNRLGEAFPFFNQSVDAHIVDAYMTAISNKVLYDNKAARRIGMATLKVLADKGISTRLVATQVSRRFRAVATPEQIQAAEAAIKDFTKQAAGNRQTLIPATNSGLQTSRVQTCATVNSDVEDVLKQTNISPRQKAKNIGGGRAHGPNKVRHFRCDI